MNFFRRNVKIKSRHFHMIYWLAMILLFAGTVTAQTMVTGKIITEQGSPVTGATVEVKETNVRTSTNSNGNFSVAIQKGQTFMISSIGFETREFSYKGETSPTISLKNSFAQLDEVVAVGYGTVTKKEVTGSVVTVKAKDFNKGDVSNPMGLIQGKVPGLTITKAGGSDPNAGYQIQLRGLNTLSAGKSPLIIVDGIMDANLATKWR